MLACEGREKRTQALRGRNLGRDIPADSDGMVRAVSASLCLPGLPFPPHWTQELMPSKIHRQTAGQIQIAVDALKERVLLG
jgi:hypothetical protein